MNKTSLVILCICVFLVGLVAKLPARVIFQFAPEAFAVGQVSGTLWQGQLGRVAINQQPIEDIQWRIYPLAMLTGRVAADVNIANRPANPLSGNMRVNAGIGGVQLNDARFNGELGQLSRWLDIPNLVPLRGDMAISVEQFRLGDPVCDELTARIGAFEVETRIGSQWHGLGDYSMQFNCDANGWVQVSMLPENMLGLSVGGSFAPGQVDLDVAMLPTRQAPNAIHDLLRLVGRPDQQGRYSFRFQL